MTLLAIVTATVLTCAWLTAVDGDTIKCDGVNMRLIGRGEPFVSGIDTPETGSRANCERERFLGREAKKRLAELLRVPGTRVEDTANATPHSSAGRWSVSGLLTAGLPRTSFSRKAMR